jgi:hypothetical protein
LRARRASSYAVTGCRRRPWPNRARTAWSQTGKTL